MKAVDYAGMRGEDGICGLVKESFATGPVGLARVEMIPGLSAPHFHRLTTEYYIVISGSGILKIQDREGNVRDIELRPSVVVCIDPGEVHQTNSDQVRRLILEVLTVPPWQEGDEIPVEGSLF